jgi:hypothetical protein
MGIEVSMDSVFVLSENVVARNIHGEFIIIPITSGIDETGNRIFSLNNFGKAIWDKLNGKRNLKELVSTLALEFEGSEAVIQRDVLGLTGELLKRGMIVRL